MTTLEGWSRKYIDPKKAERSYRPKAGGMSPGLRRAREPFLVKNAITGVILASFAVGVYAYSIQAVRQEEFEDIDELARERAADLKATAANAAAASTPSLQTTVPPPPPSSSPTTNLNPSRGVLVSLLGEKYPSVFDPERKTLVWGAPPVDNVGTVSQKK